MVARSLVVAAVLLQLTVCTRPPELGVGSVAQKDECDKWFDKQNWERAAEACSLSSGDDEDAQDKTILAYAGAYSPTKALAFMRERGIHDDATEWQLKGRQWTASKKYTAALQAYGIALALDVARQDMTRAARDLYLMADPLARMHRMNDSIDSLVLSAELAERAHARHEAALARMMEGVTRSLAGSVSRADAAFAKAAPSSVTPRDRAWLHAKQASHLLVQRERREAKKLLEVALRIANEQGFGDIRTSTSLNLARLEAEDGHPVEARRHLADSESAAQKSAYVMVEGLIAREEGKLEEAEQLLAKAAATAPDEDYELDISYIRGCIAETQGNLVVAESHYREAIKHVEAVRAKITELALRPAVLEYRRAPYEALFALLASQDRKRDALEITEHLHARAWSDAAAAIDLQHAPSVQDKSVSAVLAATAEREALVFVRAKGRLWRLHVVDGDVIELVALPELTNEIRTWTSQPEDPAMAARLGAILLPSQLAIAKGRPLYIVAPELGDLPFAALRRGEQYLIEQRELVRLPGLAVTSCRAVAPADGPPVIVADSRGDLDSAREEASYVASLLGSVADIGFAATRSRILSGRHARLLFVAAHARSGERGSALILRDGDFTAEDILEHGVAPRVAVLAGCATGDSQAPEGWGALSSSLLATGTRSVVATSRPIADKQTSTIMRAFFDAHGDTRPSAALAAAQRANLGMRARDWASFAVWGAASPDECQ